MAKNDAPKKPAAAKKPAAKKPAADKPAKKSAADIAARMTANAPSKKKQPAPALPVPPRPDGVPDGALWDAVAREWEHGALGDGECREGAWITWRADGTKRGECTYVQHEVHGTNTRFHPDGTIASEGRWVRGRCIDAIYFAYAGETDEPKRFEGGPECVRFEFLGTEDGNANRTIRYVDAAGQQRDRRGVPVPARPAGVPDTARWFSDENFHAPDGSIGGWCDGAIARPRGVPVGTWRWWSTAGELLRTQQHTYDGRYLGHVTQTEDTFRDVIAKYLADPRAERFDLARAWSPELHERMRGELRTDELTREYVYLLEDGTPDTKQWRLVLEVVRDWYARTGGGTDVHAWYLTGAAARAAVHVWDAEVGAWWERFVTLTAPKRPFPEGYGWIQLIDATPELRTTITARLAGTESADADPTTDAGLALLANRHGRTYGARVKLRDASTGEAFLVDGEERTLYWTGSAFAEPWAIFDEPDSYTHHVQQSACDERVVAWPGKHGWLLLQRYGRSVLWHGATYYASRGQAENDRHVWIRAATPALAKRVIQMVLASMPPSVKPIDPWADKKGMIVRSYSGERVCAMGIRDAVLTTAERPLETFSSHAEAIRAFEAIEIERFRSGVRLNRLSRSTP